MGKAEQIQYNINTYQTTWDTTSLPPDFPGRLILEDAWELFWQSVMTWQAENGLKADGCMGPETLRKMRGNSFDIRTVKALKEGLDLDFLAQCAREYDLNPEKAQTIFEVEAGTRSHENGLVIIRVETPGRWPNGEEAFREKYGRGQQAEWKALDEWSLTDQEKAYTKTSWGLPQIMGFNYGLVGYSSVFAMAEGFQVSSNNQVKAFFRLIDSWGLLPTVRKGDWHAFALKYNGPGQPNFYAKTIEEKLNGLERRS